MKACHKNPNDGVVGCLERPAAFKKPPIKTSRGGYLLERRCGSPVAQTRAEESQDCRCGWKSSMRSGSTNTLDPSDSDRRRSVMRKLCFRAEWSTRRSTFQSEQFQMAWLLSQCCRSCSRPLRRSALPCFLTWSEAVHVLLGEVRFATQQLCHSKQTIKIKWNRKKKLENQGLISRQGFPGRVRNSRLPDIVLLEWVILRPIQSARRPVSPALYRTCLNFHHNGRFYHWTRCQDLSDHNNYNKWEQPHVHRRSIPSVNHSSSSLENVFKMELIKLGEITAKSIAMTTINVLTQSDCSLFTAETRAHSLPWG